jgi:benzaldehyde dehydrogenase (NAD)
LNSRSVSEHPHLTKNAEAIAPFGGADASGTGARFGGPRRNVAAFTIARWLPTHGDITPNP